MFADYDAVVSPSGSCTAMVREHHGRVARAAGDARLTEAVRDTPPVYGLSEFLVDVEAVDLSPSSWPSTERRYGCSPRATWELSNHACPPPGPRDATAIACRTLRTETQAAAHARAFTRARPAEWELGGEVAEAAGVGGLGARHQRHPAQRLTPGGPAARPLPSHLWIEVCDAGRRRAPAGTEDNGVAEGGRGLWLVEALSERIGVHGTSAGTCVWALIRREPPTGL
ncbi:hypothetical protein GCM10010244_79700 [Streptomyces coeruleorubidus]|nr:hypothetical protein GCM10010244_79700 [Streptomyces bellus]